jgi:membrane protein YdbS with pleckstrin-like domain
MNIPTIALLINVFLLSSSHRLYVQDTSSPSGVSTRLSKLVRLFSSCVYIKITWENLYKILLLESHTNTLRVETGIMFLDDTNIPTKLRITTKSLKTKLPVGRTGS